MSKSKHETRITNTSTPMFDNFIGRLFATTADVRKFLLELSWRFVVLLGGANSPSEGEVWGGWNEKRVMKLCSFDVEVDFG